MINYRASAAETAPKRPSITFAEKIMQPVPDWLVEDLIQEKGLTLIYGHSGVGKSFLSLDVGLHVACGIPWHGHPVRQTPVYYLSGEGHAKFGQRMMAWAEFHGIEPTAQQFRLDEGHLDILNDRQYADLIVHLEKEIEVKPGLIVIEPLYQYHWSKPEDPETYRRIATRIGDLIRGFGVSVWLGHHTTMDGDRPRFAAALIAAADTRFLQAGNPDPKHKYGGIATLTNQKQKEASQSERWRLHFAASAESLVITDVTVARSREPSQRPKGLDLEAAVADLKAQQPEISGRKAVRALREENLTFTDEEFWRIWTALGGAS